MKFTQLKVKKETVVKTNEITLIYELGLDIEYVNRIMYKQ